MFEKIDQDTPITQKYTWGTDTMSQVGGVPVSNMFIGLSPKVTVQEIYQKIWSGLKTLITSQTSTKLGYTNKAGTACHYIHN